MVTSQYRFDNRCNMNDSSPEPAQCSVTAEPVLGPAVLRRPLLPRQHQVGLLDRMHASGFREGSFVAASWPNA